MPLAAGMRLSLISKSFEALFVDRFSEGIPAGNSAGLEQLLDCHVHGSHALSAAALHGILQLVDLSLSNQVTHRCGVDEYLQGCGPAGLTGSR